MASRWDYLLDTKPIPLVEHLLEEVSKLITQELARWPPEVAELDLATGQQFAPLFEPGRARPAATVYREAFTLARWELQRELRAVDEYMRNERWRERGLASEDKRALLFLTRWLVEQLLGLGEATEGRLKRPQLVDCLTRIERRALAALQ
ncbi:MAG: hypothetical protein ACOZIN_04970 [Myxococcota bacterium]